MPYTCHLVSVASFWMVLRNRELAALLRSGYDRNCYLSAYPEVANARMPRCSTCATVLGNCEIRHCSLTRVDISASILLSWRGLE